MKNFLNIIKLIIAIICACTIVFLLYLKSTTPITMDVEASTEVIHEPYINETITESVIIEPTIEISEFTTEEYQVINDQEWVEETKPPVLSYNTSNKSNLSESQIETILKGSPLEGSGWAFKQIEDNYNVSALFAISVAMNETTLGKFGVAESHNNCFGLTSPNGGFLYFDTKSESVLYFGSYIQRVHHNNGRYNVTSIAPVYCNDLWGDTVMGIMYDFYERLI